MTEPMAAGILQADGSVRPEPRMDAANVAEAVRYMASLPLDANVATMTVMATRMPYVGRG
jgi:NADP-dependent 3-hydroxy acid dehydrogenase YdfG